LYFDFWHIVFQKNSVSLANLSVSVVYGYAYGYAVFWEPDTDTRYTIFFETVPLATPFCASAVGSAVGGTVGVVSGGSHLPQKLFITIIDLGTLRAWCRVENMLVLKIYFIFLKYVFFNFFYYFFFNFSLLFFIFLFG